MTSSLRVFLGRALKVEGVLDKNDLRLKSLTGVSRR
jgi:hypothetical protein